MHKQTASVFRVSFFWSTVKANSVEPTDEELKKAVNARELSFANNLSKLVRYRAQVPPVVAKLSKEIYETESLEAGKLKLESPTVEEYRKLEF